MITSCEKFQNKQIKWENNDLVQAYLTIQVVDEIENYLRKYFAFFRLETFQIKNQYM